jgi:hypothetical protein
MVSVLQPDSSVLRQVVEIAGHRERTGIGAATDWPPRQKDKQLKSQKNQR